MKFLLLLPVMATAFFSSSCRTVAPLDPMTMKPSAECLPGGAVSCGSTNCTVRGTK
jgi:hypothetical protein